MTQAPHLCMNTCNSRHILLTYQVLKFMLLRQFQNPALGLPADNFSRILMFLMRTTILFLLLLVVHHIRGISQFHYYQHFKPQAGVCYELGKVGTYDIELRFRPYFHFLLALFRRLSRLIL